MRAFLILLVLSAVVWVGLPLIQHLVVGQDAAAYAESGSSGDDDDDDDDDGSGNSGSGSGNSGSGNSGSGSSGSGSSGSGGSTSGNSGSPGSGSGSSSSGTTSSGTGKGSASARLSSGFGADGISIHFTDGRVERIRNGRFESVDARGRVIAAHTARRSDVSRLKTLGAGAKRRGGSREVTAVVEVDDRGNAIEITDNRGWREVIRRGTYVVKDPNGRTVARRPVTLADIQRIRGGLGLE